MQGTEQGFHNASHAANVLQLACFLTVGGIKVGFDVSVAKPIQEANFPSLLIKVHGSSLTHSLTHKIQI